MTTGSISYVRRLCIFISAAIFPIDFILTITGVFYPSMQIHSLIGRSVIHIAAILSIPAFLFLLPEDYIKKSLEAPTYESKLYNPTAERAKKRAERERSLTRITGDLIRKKTLTTNA